MKRGSSGLSMVVGIDKPLGMTSHDVVNCCRRIFGEKRCGHTGTLDPDASGLLIVEIGPATRLTDYLIAQDKRYRFRVIFGMSSDTDDASGTVTDVNRVPDTVRDRSFATCYVEGLAGSHLQVPPAYSAVKIDGRKSYQAARTGDKLDIPARMIEIYEAKLLDVITEGESDHPSWDIEMHVSKGTYIRSIARDMGDDIGCGALIGSLRRTAIGATAIEECLPLDDLDAKSRKAILDPVSLLGLPVLAVDSGMKEDIACGRAFGNASGLLGRFGTVHEKTAAESKAPSQRLEGVQEGGLVALADEKRLYALYTFEESSDLLKPHCVFSIGVDRGD